MREPTLALTGIVEKKKAGKRRCRREGMRK
jgi:hypothetical protein